MNRDDETEIVIKAKRENYDRSEDYVMNENPYKMPEMMSIDSSFGSKKFRAFYRNKK